MRYFTKHLTRQEVRKLIARGLRLGLTVKEIKEIKETIRQRENQLNESLVLGW